jgi:hypothetical protein
MPAPNLTFSKGHMMVLDFTLEFCVVLLVILFKEHADLVLLLAWIFIVGYVLWLRRYSVLLHQVMATAFAIGWVSFASDYYGYEYDYFSIFGINTLPLMAWTLSLLALGEFCNSLNLKKREYRFFIFVPLFWFFLILFETVAYHVLGLRNTNTSGFAGIPYFDCIHAPFWMKVCYFGMGPVYYGLTLQADYWLTRISPVKTVQEPGAKTRMKSVSLPGTD